jgi:serine/threonine-protein kinase
VQSTLVAAVTLLTAALLGGGLRLISDRAAAARKIETEQAATERDADADLREMVQWMRKASWTEARNALERANARVGERGSHDIRGRLDRGARDLELAERLDAIRLTRYTTVGGVPDFARSDEKYEEAFREAGFDEVGSPPESLAAKIKASDIRNRLLVAFDNWSFCARDPRRRRWASDVAQQADGDTAGWRGRVRDPAIWKDEAALFKVIETAPFLEQSVALLLAIEMHTDAPGKTRVAFLKRLHERYPRDFWINLRLGMLLLEVGRPAEAVGYYQTALAIRPGMALTHNNLGSALTRTN